MSIAVDRAATPMGQHWRAAGPDAVPGGGPPQDIHLAPQPPSRSLEEGQLTRGAPVQGWEHKSHWVPALQAAHGNGPEPRVPALPGSVIPDSLTQGCSGSH
ncbi:hypothetical protein AAFF_G00426460 [Aldrovandia affinis]|uniref:Uncharacterized protein n=1 Tax=Aldrovandia affinis TaxID=143900 RepID=A0AAD7SBQ3_9TELE|nr:hypothetical protein AAFF_G00426460 [Aldrovandia affinis]